MIARRGHGGAALDLGIDPSTLYRDLRRLDIVEPARAAYKAHRRSKRSRSEAAGYPQETARPDAD